MKAKLTLSIDEKIIAQSKRYAQSHHTSISKLVENFLTKLSTKKEGSFAERWRGQFRVEESDEPRYQYLKEKHKL